MAKSQQTFNKLEKEKKRKKKREDKLKKMLARKDAKESGELVTNEFVYVDYNGNFTDTKPDPSEKKKIIASNIVLGVPKREDVQTNGFIGKVNFFDHSKGFGFIIDPESQEKYFVHISECIDEITEGDKVEFDIMKGAKGMNAVKVKKK
ncbi:MAG: cold shock domain-containing protein [Bacteroidetes bacterium]|jgi:cold shock CspA family protein|nr:MAG: DNA-binding protein [Cryomorphaceae bacterium BACL29 MAG-121220-bin8]MDA1019199.1 cold shock domain-containing protein [Bacteroidota bacterium]|tara:strand:- start:34228 stop:34674 length:447 start_codon:yes stop_codon:yes gene_type:complete